MSHYLSKRIPNVRISGIQQFFPLLSIILVFLYNLTGSYILMVFGIIAMCLPIMYLPIEQLGSLLFLFVPNLRMFRTLQDSQTFISIFIVLTFLKMLIVWKDKKMFDKKLILSLMFYLLTVFITISVQKSYLMISSVIRFVIDIFLLISIYKVNFGNGKCIYENMTNSYKLGCTISVLLGIIYKLYNGEDIMSNRFGGVRNDPNIFGLTMAFVISITLVDIIRKRKISIKDIIILFIVFIGGLLTLSRGFLLAVSINIFLLVIITFSKIKIFFIKKIVLFLLLIFILIYFNDYYIQIIDKFAYRFLNDTMVSGSGRTEIWMWYINETFKTPITTMFGLGGARNLLEAGTYNAVQHNLYIEIFTTMGLVGLLSTVLLYLNIYQSIRETFQGFHVSLISLFPMITLLLAYLGLSGMHSDIQIMQFILAFSTISVCLKKEKVT